MMGNSSDDPNTAPISVTEMIAWAERRLAVCESREAFRHNAPRYRDLVVMLRSLDLVAKNEPYAAGFEAAKAAGIAICEEQARVADQKGGNSGRLEAAVCRGIAAGIWTLRSSEQHAAISGEKS